MTERGRHGGAQGYIWCSLLGQGAHFLGAKGHNRPAPEPVLGHTGRLRAADGALEAEDPRLAALKVPAWFRVLLVAFPALCFAICANFPNSFFVSAGATVTIERAATYWSISRP